MQHRRSVLWGAGLALLVLVGYSALWFYTANSVRHGLADFVAAQMSKATKIRLGEPEISGFPFTIEARLGAVVANSLPYLPQAHIEMPQLIARGQLWQPGEWRFEAPQGLSFIDAASGLHIAIGAAKGRAIVQYIEAGSTVIEIDAHDVTAARGDQPAWQAHHLSLRAERPNKQSEDHTAESLGVSLTLDTIMLPAKVEPLGAAIDQLSLTAAVEGPVAETALPIALAGWRDEGGTIELHQLHLRFGQFRLSGSGTVALDQTLQPMGAFSTEMHGWSQGLDALASNGVMTPAEAGYVRTGLLLLGHKNADAEQPLAIALTLQNQLLSLGPARIAKLPPIKW